MLDTQEEVLKRDSHFTGVWTKFDSLGRARQNRVQLNEESILERIDDEEVAPDEAAAGNRESNLVQTPVKKAFGDSD